MNRKICGWDVGIKNLAYCIMSYDKTTNKFNIEKWDNIDIMDDDKIVCCATLKPKVTKNKKKHEQEQDTICEKKASYFGEFNNKTYYYCKKHKDDFSKNFVLIDDKWMTDNVKIITKEEKKICSHEITKTKKACGKKAMYSCTDKYFCASHKEIFIKNKIKNESVKSLKKKKSTSFDPQTLGEQLYKKLDGIVELLQSTDIIIENQPTLKNPSMKTVAMLLFSYFIMRGVMDKEKSKSNIINVKFVSPGYKIALNKELYDEIINKVKEHNHDNKKTCRLCNLAKELEDTNKKYGDAWDKYNKLSYPSTKELGIQYALYILNKNNDDLNKNLLNQHKKRDDLTDAFLHNYRYTKKL